MAGIKRLDAALRDLGSSVRATSRLVLASFLVWFAATLWFLVNTGGPVGPAWLLWLPVPVSSVLLVAVYRRTARADHLPAETRRFWRHLTLVGALVGAGATSQAWDALRNPDAGGQHTSPGMLFLDGLAICVIIYSLYRLPMGTRTRAQRLEIGLDASTVMVAAAIFIWHFLTAPMLSLGAEGLRTLLGSMMLSIFALVAVFAVAKVLLSSYRFIDRSALQLFGLAMFVGAIAPLPQGLVLQEKPHLVFVQMSIPATMFLAAWAGERQRIAGREPQRRFAADEPVRRPYSVLPYIAVAAVDGLLLTLTWSSQPLDKVVVVGAVGITAVVVGRQLTAFQAIRRLLERLNHGATHDALTQLPNRALFGERLNRALTAPGDGHLSVVLIDLDDFKVVNDTLGHEVGDALLTTVAERLSGCVRASDTVARLGGDEFVLVLDGVDADGADIAVERVVQALSKPVVAHGHELLVHASIGIADGRTGDDASRLLRHADIAMYAAKAVDGNHYLHYRPDMAGAVADQAHVGVELRQAIADEQLFLLYQPIVSLDGGRLTGVEALVRWAHPERGTLSPIDFIPVAERSGLVVPLGRWILRTACRQMAEWIAAHGAAAPPVMNVNASARELREPGFADDVTAALEEAGLDPRRLAIEVTETTMLEVGAAVSNLSKLRELGIRIALDDFGTGYSTLTLLQECPVDELKLDRSFTQADPAARPTVAAAVLHIAQAMGLDVVAEGVETAQQADRLRQLGYATAQGYLFARPMPADKLGELVASRVPAGT
jgi:diguanylate cyclase (GGDEF)-like protein